MGLIKDIVDNVVPKVQKRVAENGTDIKEALLIELEEMGYIPKKEGGYKFESKNWAKNNG